MPEEINQSTVLVVDDDQGLMFLIEQALRREIWSVATANSGAAALEWLGRNSADLMLLDLRLADIGAGELVDRLAAAGRPVPFIIITGQGDERVAVEMMKRGALDYLIKDLQFTDFLPTLVRRGLTRIAKDKRLAFAERKARLMLAVIEQSCNAVIIASNDGPNSLVEYLNPAFAKLTGFPVEKLIGNSLSELETAIGSLEPFRRILSTGGPLLQQMQLRIAQEAVNNAVKHGGARTIRIFLGNSGGKLELNVSDNGHGFSTAAVQNNGMGLRAMKYRADLIGAALKIDSAPGNGTQVVCVYDQP